MAVSWSKTKLLGPEDVPPSGPEFQVVGAFNPGAAEFDGGVVLLLRVAQSLAEKCTDEHLLPRHEPGRGYVADRFHVSEIEQRETRVVSVKATRDARLTSVSYLRVAYCGDGHRVERFGAELHPMAEYEEYGMEDPRITRLGDTYYITYVAVSRHGVATALASTKDFETFERHGIIFPPENKDVMLFPEKIGGKYVALHRPVCAIPFTGPEMWLGRSPDRIHWGEHAPLYRGHMAWESGRVGGGAPPIRTERGWLVIYHGNVRPTRMGHVGAYCGGAMLLALDDPSRILKVAAAPLMEPTEPYEREGFVPHVVFPTGVIEREGGLLVYYGAADACTAVGEIAWDALWKAFD